MIYDEYIDQSNSKKITLVEIDTPIVINRWINYSPGLWFTRLTPTSETIVDDYGVSGYWEGQNNIYYNIQSLNVDGELYTEVGSTALLYSTNKSWYYDSTTTDFYIHLDGFAIPEEFIYINPGAAIGFTHGKDTTTNNYYENISYDDLILSLPNLTKSRDPLFFGILRYEGGSITFNNTSGYFDDFATRDLYGQPVRIYLGFEGLDYSEYQILYTGRVEDFKHDLETFMLNVKDQRKLLGRKLPVNTFNVTDYPDMDEKYFGTPIPIAYGSVINAPAYKTTDTGGTETWKFCDTSINAVNSVTDVVDKDGNSVSYTASLANGIFTSTSTEKNLYVTFSVSITNGLSIIEDILENYEGVTYNNNNYNVSEWESAYSSVSHSGMWFGKGNEKSTADIIEQICVDNNGVFEVLNDGRYTFRIFNPNIAAIAEIQDYELLKDASIDYESEEYLTSVNINHSKNWLEKEYQQYKDLTYEDSVFGRYRSYKEKEFNTTLVDSDGYQALAARIMRRSDFIYPKIRILTKMQYSDSRVMDAIIYTYKRQNGSEIIPRSRWEIIEINLDLTGYETELTLRQIEEIGDADSLIITGQIDTDNIMQTTPAGEEQTAPISG